MAATKIIATIIAAIVVIAVVAYLLTVPPQAPSPTPTPTPTPAPTPTPTPTPTPKGVKLTVITRHPSVILDKARSMFLASELARRYHVEDVEFIKVEPGVWAKYIVEKKVDVAWGGGPPLFDLLYRNGLLAPLEGPEVREAVAQIPDEASGMPLKRVGPDGKVYWVASAISSFGLTVNFDFLDKHKLPTPRRWIDLASPEIGRALIYYELPAVGFARPTKSTSTTRMFEIILQAHGWEEGWRVLTLIAANGYAYMGSEDVREAVIRGDIGVGLTIDYYGYTAMLHNPRTLYVLPEDGTAVNGDPIALCTTSEHPDAAQAFIAWVLTEGQTIWLDPSINRMPANPSVFDTPAGAKRPDLKRAYEVTLRAKAIEFNETLAESYEQAMQYYFEATLVEEQESLRSAWVGVLKCYFEGKLNEEQFRSLVNSLTALVKFKDPETNNIVEFTESYAVRINPKLIRDPAFRDNMVATWRQAARQKYMSVLEELKGICG